MTDDNELHALLAKHEAASAPRFATGFADRVMARVSARPVLTIELALERYARRMLPSLAAASLLLGAWNWWTVRDRAPSTFGAVLGVIQPSANFARTSASLGLINTEAFE